MSEEGLTENQGENSENKRLANLLPHQWKKGQSGNPAGRPAGKTLKTYAREMLERMTDEEREEFFNGIDKKIIWEMAEGKPSQDIDHTTLGKELPTPIINVLGNNSHTEDNSSQEEN